jgi:nucleotide-binding universal stress UspA family protein
MTEQFLGAERDIDIPIKTIVHPTDCSGFSADAFAHALRIAIAAKADLHPLHVAKAEDTAEAPAFPQAQRMLAQWGLIGENDNPAIIAAKFGTRITNVKLDAQSPEKGILRFLNQTAADLVVLATHRRDVLELGWPARSPNRRFVNPQSRPCSLRPVRGALSGR